MTLEQAFVEKALSFVQCHYIWGGKGNKLFTVNGLVDHAFTDMANPPNPLNIFDCSGLVTTCLWLVTQGRIDLRGTHGAKTMWDSFPIYNNVENDGMLRLYPGHVAISLGNGRVVEAAGGDESTTNLQASIDRNAKVRVGLDLRNPSTLLGLRRIPLDKSELRTV